MPDNGPSAEPAKPDPFEELADHLEGGVRVRDLGKLLRCFKAKTVWTLLGSLAAVFSFGLGAGYFSYQWIHPRPAEPARGADQPQPRARPTGLTVARALSSDSARNEHPWLGPTLDFLEREAASELERGQWAASTAVVLVTNPFPQATEAFPARLVTPAGHQVSGYAFLSDGPEAGAAFRYLDRVLIRDRGDSKRPLRVPEAPKGASIMLAVRVSAQTALEVGSPRFRSSVSFSLE